MRQFRQLVAIYLLLSACPAPATLQIPDLFCLDKTNAPIEWPHSPVREFFESRPELWPHAELFMTSLGRGYIAHYELRERKVFIKDLLIPIVTNMPVEGKPFDFGWTSVCSQVFPRDTDRWMKWFSGLILVRLTQEDKSETYIDSTNRAVCRLIYVDAGNVRADREFSANEYSEYARLQFHAFTNSAEFAHCRDFVRTDMAGVTTNITDEFVFRMMVGYRMRTIVNYKDFQPNVVPRHRATADGER
jgi:hypothetical protein